MTASMRSPRPARQPAIVAVIENPTNPSARRTRLRLSPPAKGFNRAIEPHSTSVVRRRQVIDRQSSSTRCSRYQGSDVTT